LPIESVKIIPGAGAGSNKADSDNILRVTKGVLMFSTVLSSKQLFVFIAESYSVCRASTRHHPPNEILI
jgi:hypothetical protein